MKDLTWQQVKAKMQYLRTKFVCVKTWLEGTGQGVDSGTIEEYKNAKCPFYNQLHGIFAAKANITIPYQFDSLQATDSMANKSSTAGESSEANIEETSESQVNPVYEYIVEENGEIEIYADVDANVDSSSTDLDLPSTDLDLTSTNVDLTSTDSILDVDDFLSSLVTNEPSISKSQNTRIRTHDEYLAFARFAHVPGEDDSEQDVTSEPDVTRMARFKKQLLERPEKSNKTKNQKPEIPSNASAYISDANMKRAESLQERNQIEFRRVDNEKAEIDLSTQRFELEKVLHLEQLNASKKDASIKDNELVLKEKEQQENFELRKANFDLKCKKLALKKQQNEESFQLKLLELEKAERIEKIKIEFDFKLQLELAKLKNQS